MGKAIQFFILFLITPMFTLHSGTCQYEEYFWGGSSCVGDVETNGMWVTVGSKAECDAICAGGCTNGFDNRMCIYTR